MSNYTMPPRLRASDYAKGKISQDEIIALQIANDANIAKARKALKMGEIQQPTPMQSASPDELLADVASQEAAARSNIERLGFRPQEAAQIVTSIRIDPTLDFASLNANFPAIEADIKKRFNVKLLTPTFFLDYFRKYSQELEGTTGMRVFDTGVNGLINTVGELRTILPSREQFQNLLIRVRQIRDRTKQSALLNPILERLSDIEKALPTDNEYGKIEQLNPVTKERIIDEINKATEDLPSREQVDEIIRQVDRGNASGLSNLANSIDVDINRKLDRIMKEIREIQMSQDEILLKRQQVPTPKNPRTNVWDDRIESITSVESFKGLSGKNQREFLMLLFERGDTLIDDEGNIITKKTRISNSDSTGLLKPEIIRTFERWLNSKPASSEASAAVSDTGSYISSATPAGVAETFARGERQQRPPKIFLMEDETSGSGMPYLSKTPNQRIKTVKVGKGLSIKQTPSYREYGKYAIHIPQLEQQDILNVKYKSLGGIPKFKPIPVSDVFRDFILDLLENGKPNSRVYTQIAPEERKFFEEMSIGAGVWNGLGLKRTTTSTDEEENKRFEILRGEYMAGNNNPKVISELRKLVVKMMNDGRIRKNQGVELLMELSI